MRDIIAIFSRFAAVFRRICRQSPVNHAGFFCATLRGFCFGLNAAAARFARRNGRAPRIFYAEEFSSVGKIEKNARFSPNYA